MYRLTTKVDVSTARTEFLPFALPDVGSAELDEIKDAIESGWITTGPKTRQFEAEFAARVGASHAIAVNSCTAAMHLALDAIGLQPGDIVLTTPYTFAATAEVIRYFDAIPVFVDIDPDTLNIDPEQLEATIENLHRSLTAERGSQSPAVAHALKNNGHASNGHASNGHASNGHASNGHASNGHASNGHASNGHASNGHASNGHASSRGIAGAHRIKAIIPVHFAGLPADMGAIHSIAAKYELAVIEDAAHAFPARYNGTLIGQDIDRHNGLHRNGSRSARFTCFSFYATKTITTGEGGMICTDNGALAERCRIMALHGISKDAWKRYTAEGSWYYEVIAPGYKYNMSDIAAAMGLAQLRKAERMWKQRQAISWQYNEAFGSIAGLQIPANRSDCQHAWHIYPLRLDLGQYSIDRAQFIQELKKLNIGTSVHFIPLHIQPYYQEIYGYKPLDFPVAFSEFQRVISLPIYSKMSDQDVEDVINAVLAVVNRWAMI